MKQFDWFKKLSKTQKIEFTVSLILTVTLIIALPVYAWFANNKKLETITKIKEPGEIIIRAGKKPGATEADSIVNFEMQDIDIESIAEGKPQCFVFSVLPDEYNMGYKLQLAHTTNIPFTYTIYKASAPDTTGMTNEQLAQLVIYHPRNDNSSITYYQKDGSALSLTALNEDDGTAFGRTIAKQNDVGDEYKCYSQTYAAGDTPEIYAVPVYLQSETQRHSESASDSYDYYILELGWDESANIDDDYAFTDWNTGKNNKETDIIYITAARQGG